MGEKPGLFEELKRRKVFRVSTMYAVVGWVLLQVGEITFEPLGLPEGSLRTLIFAVVLGFPVAIALGWLFDWTSEGIVRSSAQARDEKPHLRFDVRTDFAWLMALGVALVVFAIGYGSYLGYSFWSQVRWAQEFAQPELVKRIESNDFPGAFALNPRFRSSRFARRHEPAPRIEDRSRPHPRSQFTNAAPARCTITKTRTVGDGGVHGREFDPSVSLSWGAQPSCSSVNSISRAFATEGRRSARSR